MSRPASSARRDLSRMLVLLQQEQRELKRADMSALMRLAPRKTALLARLEGHEAQGFSGDEVLLQRVRDDAARNARLYEAALRGLNDARALLARIKAPNGDRTYARNGERHTVTPAKTTLERRA